MANNCVCGHGKEKHRKGLGSCSGRNRDCFTGRFYNGINRNCCCTRFHKRTEVDDG
jgi:hypothetical protein